MPSVPCHRRYIDLMLEVRATQGTGVAHIALKAAAGQSSISDKVLGSHFLLVMETAGCGPNVPSAPRCCTAFDGREDVGQRLTVQI